MNRNHLLKKDDAVANVVIMMLILSIIVIAFAIIVGIYLPSQKETAEIQHSEEVKEAFLQFSSDIDTLYTRAQPGLYSQLFELGGGDIMLSTSRSAGTVEIDDEFLVNLTFSNATYSSISLYSPHLTYTPVLSFWENQSYEYSKGVVWIRKNSISVAPASAAIKTVNEGIKEQESTKSRWIDQLGSLEVKSNITEIHNASNVSDVKYTINDTYTITLVNFTTIPGKDYLSGNGNAKLSIRADKGCEMEYMLYNLDTLKIGNKTLLNVTRDTYLRVKMINATVSIE